MSPVSFNPMISQHQRTPWMTPLMFGAVVQVGRKDGLTFLTDLFHKHMPNSVTADLLETPQVSAEEERRIHFGIKELILAQQPTDGPLVPMVDAHFSLEEAVSTQRDSTPSAFSLHGLYQKLMEDKNVIWAKGKAALDRAFLGSLPAARTEFGRDIEQLRQDYASLQERAKSVQRGTVEHVRLMTDFNGFMANGVRCEMNTEALEPLIETPEEATLFVVSHTDPPTDVNRAFAVLHKLYEGYQKAGVTEAPGTRFIMAERYTQMMPEPIANLLTQIEILPVDASAYASKEREGSNREGKKQALEAFRNNQSNLLIFPAGGRNLYNPRYDRFVDETHPSLDEAHRFQYGLSKFVTDALKTRKRVRVVSLATDVHGAIHIGKPLYFEKTSQGIEVSGGNLNALPAPDLNDHPFLARLARTPNYPLLLQYGDKPVPFNTVKADLGTRDYKIQMLMNRLVAGMIQKDLEACDRLAVEDYQNSPLSKKS